VPYTSLSLNMRLLDPNNIGELTYRWYRKENINCQTISRNKFLFFKLFIYYFDLLVVISIYDSPAVRLSQLYLVWVYLHTAFLISILGGDIGTIAWLIVIIIILVIILCYIKLRCRNFGNYWFQKCLLLSLVQYSLHNSLLCIFDKKFPFYIGCLHHSLGDLLGIMCCKHF
jgi:hypothetical protein